MISINQQNSLQKIYAKLLAFDINSLTHLTSHPKPDPNIFYRKGVQITHLEIAGVVVTRDHKPDKFLRFLVDDGTGCVQCILWLNQLTSPYFSRRCPSDVRCIAQMAGIFASRAQLGQFVRVRGRVSGFRGEVQVTVDDVVVDGDPNSDILHWLDCVKLARKHYDVLSCNKSGDAHGVI